MKMHPGKTTLHPIRPRQRSRSPGSSQAAFTLIEIMVVVIILGVLAATIIPQFRGTTADAKIGVAKSNIAVMKTQLEMFYLHLDRFPTTEEGLQALVKPPSGAEEKWRGPYIEVLRPDPWGNPYQYRQPGTREAGSYDLWSRGADGAEGGDKEAADIGNWME